MPTPYESLEYLETLDWTRKARNKSLLVSNCIAGWTDICGFGTFLERAKWNLNTLQENGIVHFLNELHSIAGRPFLINVDPYPNDKVIVLNDGIARTVDLHFANELGTSIFLFYLRDLLFSHYNLLSLTKSYDIGVRTILAGGQKIQYSPSMITGHSSLFYDKGNTSPFGSKLLNTTFVYNPAEFQMNTGFAKAFTIDGLGTKNNIRVNGLYIESDFFTKLSIIPDLEIKIMRNRIKIFMGRILMFELGTCPKKAIVIKGLEMAIYQILTFKIYKEFDGEEFTLDMFNQED